VTPTGSSHSYRRNINALRTLGWWKPDSKEPTHCSVIINATWMTSPKTTLSLRIWGWEEDSYQIIKNEQLSMLVRHSFMVGRLKYSKTLRRLCHPGCFLKNISHKISWILESLCLTKPSWQKKWCCLLSTELNLYFKNILIFAIFTSMCERIPRIQKQSEEFSCL
jgi:hypothetical protein